MTVRSIEAEHCHDVRATLGEGPVWDRSLSVLWFVDIGHARVHRFDPATGTDASWPAPDKVGWVLPNGDGTLTAGLAKALHRFDPADGSFTLLHGVETDDPTTRINDATRDPLGVIWFGTMSGFASVPAGRYYRFDGHGIADTGLAPMKITNGPAVSADRTILYAVDTLAGEIVACPIGTNGELGEPRLFVSIDAEDGYPDGVTCDRAGGVWVGLWNGWSARRYDASGQLTDVVKFPVANVTKIALGGPEGRTAYATTAREGQEGDTSGHQPLGGDLFRFPVAIPAIGVA